MFPDDVIEEKRKNGNSVQARAEGSTLFNLPGAGYDMPLIFNIAGYADSTPTWQPQFPLRRDRYLRRFYKSEDKLAGAVYSMTARIKSLDYRLEGPPRAKKYFQTVLDECEGGRGYRALIGKFLTDLYTTDNGGFIELVGSGNPMRPLKGPLQPPYMMHMDSLLAWRTFDEEFPVVYTNPLTGKYHLMHKTRIVYASSHEQPDELARGIGFCPTSRILRYAQLIRNELIYMDEKVSGKFTRAIGFVNGVNQQQGVKTLEAAEQADASKGYLVYKGIPFFMRAEGGLSGSLLDLASLPDGFNLETHMNLYMHSLALAFGVDAREFWPATASGATKADATVQHLKAQGKGIGDGIEIVEYVMRAAAPDTVEFETDFTDDEQDELQSRIRKQRVETISNMKRDGGITVQEYRTLLIAWDIVDVSHLEAVTPEDLEAQGVNDSTPREQLEETTGETPEELEDKPALETPEQDNPKFAAAKELSATQSAFEAAFSNILSGAMDSDYSRVQAQNQLYRLVQRYGTQAYIDGLADGGVEISGTEELERTDLRTIANLLSQQNDFISDFMKNVYSESGISEGIAGTRPTAWFNGSILPFYTAGVLAADANGLYEFSGTSGEKSCVECQILLGQRHRLIEWVEKQFNPPGGAKLSCSGGKMCRHTLVRVRGRARGSWA